MVIGMQVLANLTDKVIGGNYNDLLKTIIGASCSNQVYCSRVRLYVQVCAITDYISLCAILNAL